MRRNDDPQGLSSEEAQRRLAAYGANAVPETRMPRWRVFLGKLWSPLPWMLEGAVVLQIGLHEYIEAAVIGGLLLLNALLGFMQEGRASAALAALKSKLAHTALVCRDGVWARRPAADIVPGDVIRLTLGALVPADARIVSGSLLLDQSTVTGESAPVEAAAGATAYAGALVRRGQAVAEVTATGSKTYSGRAAVLVQVAHATSSEQAATFATVRNLTVVNGAIAASSIAYALHIGLPHGELVRLALSALLASIPVALPAVFTLSAAITAQLLTREGVLLTRLSAAHDASTMDLLCSDKTGTLTRNTMEIGEVVPMEGTTRDRVLTLAAFASAAAGEDPIDTTIRQAAALTPADSSAERPVRFVPFDPGTRMAEAAVIGADGQELRIIKGAFYAVAEVAQVPANARSLVDELAARGQRVIAVAVGSGAALRLAGLIALGDPPRPDSAQLIASLREMGVRTVMVTGDSPATAAAVARKVGIDDSVCPPERLAQLQNIDECTVFARVVPEDKYRLVKALQGRGHIVGMCGDGANDGPALRQAQIGIAVASATDVAKAAAAMVLTEPGLAGILVAVREGRIADQRLLTYTLTMLVKKIEIVLFLALGLVLTGHLVIPPILMVLLLVTNDFLSMSLTTDRASAAPSPSAWRMRRITAAGATLAVCKLGFSTAMLVLGQSVWRLSASELQSLAFVTLAFGNQAVLYVVRERGHLWSSMPSRWVVASSVLDVTVVCTLALFGLLMDALPGAMLATVFVASMVFALVLDQVKRPLMRLSRG